MIFPKYKVCFVIIHHITEELRHDKTFCVYHNSTCLVHQQQFQEKLFAAAIVFHQAFLCMYQEYSQKKNQNQLAKF